MNPASFLSTYCVCGYLYHLAKHNAYSDMASYKQVIRSMGQSKSSFPLDFWEKTGTQELVAEFEMRNMKIGRDEDGVSLFCLTSISYMRRRLYFPRSMKFQRVTAK
jgi:hypothetical protein